ncbi:hypothetical protein NDR87_10570 [Nocardia sp. CDC159]|uniref:Uncharacterized protein n=1 Tax=Nocardia pulmonis TaxID=2951408 RepID=A0A9X2E6A2_9NOCA|nr:MULTISPECIES: hypothetical protein [Nocardia]MCM6773913.1 hypothetical protein [Nocardia pulmonis]MCM6786800.1 hypothetical protein [Nocardia sp. CDC159]
MVAARGAGYWKIAPHAAQVLARGGEARVLILGGLRRRPPHSVGMPFYAGLTAKALDISEVPGGVCTSIGTLHHTSRIPAAPMYLRDISLHIGMPSIRPLIPAVLDLMAGDSFQPERVTTDMDNLDNAVAAMRRYVSGESLKTVRVE